MPEAKPVGSKCQKVEEVQHPAARHVQEFSVGGGGTNPKVPQLSVKVIVGWAKKERLVPG